VRPNGVSTSVLKAMALSLIAATTITSCGTHGSRPRRPGPAPGGFPTMESVVARYSMPDRDMAVVDNVKVYRLTWRDYLSDAQGTPAAPGGLYTSAPADQLRSAGAQVPRSDDVVYLVAQHGSWIPPLNHGAPYKWRFVTVTATSGTELHVSGAMSDDAPSFLSRFKDARSLERST